MNIKTALRLSVVVLAPLLAVPSLTQATNGSLLIGHGAKSRAMGGVGVAYAQDGLAAAVNPAGIANVGTRADLGVMLFRPKRSAWVPGFSGRDEIDSGANLFLIPNMGGAYKFNRKMSFGFAAIGAGGGNTRYSENFFDFSGDPPPTLGVNLMQMVMSPSVSYKLARNHAVGASLLIGVQSFRAYGVTAFADAGFSSNPRYVSNKGNDFSYGAGARIGWTSNFFKDRLTIGAAASSKVYMTKFDKYKGLFADEGSFDMPPIYAVGVAVKPTDKLTLAADFQYIDYSAIDAISNLGPTQFLPLPPADRLLGAKNGLGFGWDDMKIYKIGASYDLNDRWVVRAGFNYGKSPIKDGQLLFNTLAPATVERHVTMGFTYKSSPNSEWSFAGMYALKNRQVAYDTFSGDNIRLSMHQYALDISYGYFF